MIVTLRSSCTRPHTDRCVELPTMPEEFPNFADPGSSDCPTCFRNRFAEGYAYDIFGNRIGVLHCANYYADPVDEESGLAERLYGGPDNLDYPNGQIGYPRAAFGCKDDWIHIRSYDYVDGQLLVERQQGDISLQQRLNSVYTWGPTGLVARRGVSLRDGEWNSGTGSFELSDPPNPMCDYDYFLDHMGNVAALVDCATGNASRQLFDAFGVLIGDPVRFQCGDDHDHGELLGLRYCSETPTSCPTDPELDCGPPCPDPLPEAQPVERLAGGSFAWRGGEGSQTDRVHEDQRDIGNLDVIRYSAETRASTGLIYMQARYYEPETGRFTQADPLSYGLEAFSGQNNRWTYCANDPVNSSDPSGLVAQLMFGAGMVVGIGIGAYLGFNAITDSGFDGMMALLSGLASLAASLLFDAAASQCNIGYQSWFFARTEGLLAALGFGAGIVAIAKGMGLAGLAFLGGVIAGIGMGLALGGLTGAAYLAISCKYQPQRHRDSLLHPLPWNNSNSSICVMTRTEQSSFQDARGVKNLPANCPSADSA